MSPDDIRPSGPQRHASTTTLLPSFATGHSPVPWNSRDTEPQVMKKRLPFRTFEYNPCTHIMHEKTKAGAEI